MIVYILQTDYSKGIIESFVNFYKLMLGNSGPYEEYQTNFSATLTLTYMLSTLILVVIMLNLLISIIGNTYGRVSEVNELIYEKNRLMLVKDFLSDETKRKRIGEELKHYIVTVYKEDPDLSKLSEIEQKFYHFETKMDVKFDVNLIHSINVY